jgi:uncharacterized protein YgiM (DUF1202 family)
MFTTTQPRARWTLVAALILGLAGGAVAPQVAHADQTVRTNTEANLRARPGERAPTLAHLDEGQTVRVLGRQGRWLKVSVKGKVGWITRTQVADDGEAIGARASSEKKRTAAAKARKKGWKSMDDEAVGADAVEGEDEGMAEDEDDKEAKEDAKPSKKEAKAEEREEKEERAKTDEEDDAKADKKKDKKDKKQASAKIAKGGEVVAVRSVAVRAKPNKKADEKYDVKKGTQLTVLALNEEGDWIKVEDSEGEKGWVKKKDLRVAGSDDMGGDDSGDAVAESDSESSDSEGATDGVTKTATPQGPMSFWVSANAGVLNRSQTYVSAGSTIRANYQLANTAPAVIGGLGLVRRMGKFNLGADAGVSATVGGSGIAIPASGEGAAETLGWTALEIDAHGSGQYVLSPKGYAIGARLGYHVSSITVDVSQQAKLPSEKLSGFTIGAGFWAPMLTDKISMMVSADYLLGATLLQTEGLKDGDNSAAQVIFMNAGLGYAFSPKLAANVSYQLSYENFQFAGANQRQPDAANAKRQDVQHVFGLGMAYTF